MSPANWSKGKRALNKSPSRIKMRPSSPMWCLPLAIWKMWVIKIESYQPSVYHHRIAIKHRTWPPQQTSQPQQAQRHLTAAKTPTQRHQTSHPWARPTPMPLDRAAMPLKSRWPNKTLQRKDGTIAPHRNRSKQIPCPWKGLVPHSQARHSWLPLLRLRRQQTNCSHLSHSRKPLSPIRKRVRKQRRSRRPRKVHHSWLNRSSLCSAEEMMMRKKLPRPKWFRKHQMQQDRQYSKIY